jgi:uncharacterized protein YeaO (DUF488 family)
MSGIRLKRAYDPAEPEDGTRILVDCLWPRGLSRGEAKVDHWLRDVAPSAELRRWFGHDPAKWAEFRRRYAAELAHNPSLEGEYARSWGDCLMFGGQAAAAKVGWVSFAGANLCPKAEPKVPL